MQQNDCKLCKYLGGSVRAINEVPRYVEENVGKVSFSEMTRQIIDILKAEGVTMTAQEIEVHFTKHTQTPKVVLGRILADLHDVMAVAKSEVVVTDEENHTSINPKALQSYLETVKNITAIYKMDGMKST